MGMNRTYLVLVVILATVGALAAVGVYFGYQFTLQPSIRATSLDVGFPVRDTQATVWLDMGMVSGQGSFNYHPINQTAEYIMFFTNPSSSSDRFVNFTYTNHWPDFFWATFTLTPGKTETVYVHANSGEQLGGDFWVSGGGSDVGFKIMAYTCSEVVSFSFALVNTGGADGYANVAFMVDGASLWSGRYLVQAGSTLPISGSVEVPDCSAHTYDVVVLSQSKS